MSFQPTYGIMETARNAKSFCKQNFPAFKHILIPLVPFLFLAGFARTIVQPAGKPGAGVMCLFLLTALAASYLRAILAVAWHRYVILGPEPERKISVFSLEKNNWLFLGYTLLLAIMSVLFGVVVGVAAGFTIGKEHVAVLGLLIVAVFCIVIFVAMRLSLVLPSVAIDKNMGLRKSFVRSKGLVLKLLFSTIMAAIGPLILMIVYFVILSVASFLYLSKFSAPETGLSLGYTALFYILYAPIDVLVLPWITVLGVTCISNYYLWTKKSAP